MNKKKFYRAMRAVTIALAIISFGFEVYYAHFNVNEIESLKWSGDSTFFFLMSFYFDYLWDKEKKG